MSVGTDQRALDELCVNTIRTLSMDAVQAANSGHPGTPMALAPITYLLYTRVMRHSPADPHWPGRDRFVLSCGHASMLLYSTLLPGGLRRHARPDQALPPARLALRGSPGVRARAGRGDDDRAARAGDLHGGRDGARRAHAGRPLQPRRPRARRPLHLLHRLRRRHGGGDLLRGIVDRRPSRPRPADRVLRRQPHLDRGRHEALLLRGCRRPLRGVRLARAEPARGHRARPPGGGAARRPGGRGPPQPDHRPHAHRARLAEQAGHPRRARVAARRGGDPADQGGLRLSQPRALLRPRGGAGALPRRGRARARAAGRVGRGVRRLPRGLPCRGGRVRALPGPTACRTDSAPTRRRRGRTPA